MPIFGVILSTIGGIFKSILGFKESQAKTVQSALDVVKSINDTDAAAITATANALSTILTQGSWLEKSWRPVLMCLCIVVIGCWFFGYIPPHFNDPVSPMMDKILNLLMIGVGGYIPARTIDKAIQQISLGSILKEFIRKKVL